MLAVDSRREMDVGSGKDPPRQSAMEHAPDEWPSLRLLAHPLIQEQLATLRNRETPVAGFRRAMQTLAALMVPEVTRGFETRSFEVVTPLATAPASRPLRPIVLVPILRAGIGLLDGMLEILPQAMVGHIGLYRDEDTVRPVSYYTKLPAEIADGDVLLLDPMLASGHSACAAVDQLKQSGATRIHFVCVLAAPEGLRQFNSTHPDVPVYCAAVDSHLNEASFIVPGLGDAGDRYYGTI